MRTRFLKWWETLQSSYWFIPTLMAIFAVILSAVMINIDTIVKREVLIEFNWLYVSEADGGRAVLSTIAGSMITVAGVVFSITMVALTLASQQFGPRLLSNFMRDRGNQVVLGIFIATFVYCLLVLRTITSLEENEFIPQLSVLVGVLLALISISVLIYFIHHISESIRVSHIILEVNKELLEFIQRLYPEKIGHAVDVYEKQRVSDAIPRDFDENIFQIPAPTTNYLQAIEHEVIMQHAEKHDLLIRLPRHPGEFIIENSVIAEVWHKEKVNDDLIDALQVGFIFANQRTPTQDIVLLFDKLVEIAVRALSPGINDPFTAITCIDRLTEALHQLVTSHTPSAYRFDDQNILRIIAEPTDVSDLIHRVITPIRIYGASDPSVIQRLLDLIQVVASHAHESDIDEALRQQANLLQQTALTTLISWDATQITKCYQQVCDKLDWEAIEDNN